MAQLFAWEEELESDCCALLLPIVLQADVSEVDLTTSRLSKIQCCYCLQLFDIKRPIST
ncbi:hypothetical protein MtrunA17_Chr2g0289731 [Medicago truncatula]|uniref:Uncharacterized protein n=1 Tax=Medicago truncatula TaxID=3880 RepID=Q2HT26_MEDTR|nr:hypothetical protein MtrDRAFT_AC150798g23v2 [Medicago truncatula]RHN72616.1 hypothetical protein MtrunA17_Chr2g0289731 [Medicago truncatula]